MESKPAVMMRLGEIISEELGVPHDEITEESTWLQLGADSLDRLGMSQAIEEAFKVEIPHQVGERLNTVGETVNEVVMLISRSGRQRVQ